MNWRTRTVAAGSLVVLMAGATVAWAQVARFTENWNASTSLFFNFFTPGRSTVTSNVNDPAAEDGKVVRLELAARSSPGPRNGPAVESKSTEFQYGTFTTRLRTADCSAQPKAGVVSGFFTFFNDNVTDTNGNGLPDNSEIDIEWLCAKPWEIYLTMWTDFRESDSAQRRVLRFIDLRTGEIKRTCFFQAFGFQNCVDLTGNPNEGQPSIITPIPNYQPDKLFYEYGFTWTADRVVWWIVNPATARPIILWDYRNATRIPDNPAQYITNVWHSTGFIPPDMPSAKMRPRVAIPQLIDWTEYDPLAIFPSP
jgi:beta-glucanase (GH16 family)